MGEPILYWFVQEGRWFQLCFAANDAIGINRMERKVRVICKKKGFTTKRLIRGTLGGALGGQRWVATTDIGTPAERKRSAILVDLMHKVCMLYIDNLVKNKAGVWAFERNDDPQNPHHNVFESLMHLIANVSNVKFDVHMLVRTVWMPGYQQMKATCNL